jgi:hypothetical protein
MINRIIISIAASLLVASFAFSQMKYSRANSQKPTPTPTPLPLIPAQKTTATPRTTPTPTPAKPGLMPRVTPTPAQLKSTPLQKTPPAQTQPLIPAQKITPMPRATPTPQPRTNFAPRATPAPVQQKALPTPAPTVAKPTPTPVPPPDVKAYLDRQVANSKDQKFHFTVNGKDLALTPFHVWAQKSTGPNSTSTCIDMKSDDGRIYDIDFVTTGAQVSSIRIHRINGESPR